MRAQRDGAQAWRDQAWRGAERSGPGGWLARNEPRQIPVILLGMLGVDERDQGVGLGHDLLVDAVRRARSVAQEIGARALVVESYDDSAREFYRHHGLSDVPGARLMYARLI